MANLQNADWSAIRSFYDQVDDLILENKRLEKLVDDLQKEIEFYLTHSLYALNDEIHPMEEK